jgi:1-acyl-sn-glycerol-3-phosphate acyltransferase
MTPTEMPSSAHEPIDSSITPLIAALTLGGRTFGRALTRVRIEGAVDEIPRDGPVIIAANHASNLDAVVIGSWLIPKIGRRFEWLGKKELFDWPVVGYFAAHGGVHPVDRATADVEAYRLAKRILDEGHVLFIFPEGTRSPDGALQHGRDGVSSLALRTGAPIVPVAIAGSDRVWPRGQKLPRPGGRSRSASAPRSVSPTSSRRTSTNGTPRPWPQPSSWAGSRPSSPSANGACTAPEHAVNRVSGGSVR